MGRESHDPTSFHSSIALLQERFRQLQRVKQMREERELQKMLNEPKQFTSNSTLTYHNSNTCSILSHPEFIMPSTSPPHVSLSLWPSSQSKQDDYASAPTPVSTHSQSLQLSWKNVYDSDSGADSGVDTSLHL
ncbi:hypothetical protein VIGAN_05092800 [Vigna angularis var. angularis]|uniref:Uncharacterized protein n=2 Tax=Phaseolus angularis TaxID=3914 RepID=A0A0S3S3Y2_PHAAN|nr:uncharacterized protein LOC108341620 [Vigna angularis]BAT87546.1 hypothetical protein VIGAN_05092800 [Vigna angularis var. angularis]